MRLAEEAEAAAASAATATTEAAAEAAAAEAEAAATAAEQAASDATEAATDAATGAGDSLAELLTVEGFDFDSVAKVLNESDLGAVQKNVLTQGLKAAQDNPELLGPLLDSAREALGL